MVFTSLVLAATLFLGTSSAAPAPSAQAVDTTGFIAAAPGSTSYWISNIQRQGTVAFGTDAGYKVFRNVQTDCGAKGDGATDDTAAINQCIANGNRCGSGCDSSTITPAMVYFPPGTYMVNTPIQMQYYTQMVGDALNPPTIKGMAGFTGMALVDADPYDPSNGNQNWFTNQNNFFRQVRNFVIDMTAMPMTSGAGIHWQVAQATSLQNIRFEMVKGGDAANKQIGVFMDNGSGGFMTDLTFNGGNYGMFLGNQQFTTRNLTFNDCNTAIFMNWNWLWTFKSVNINNCKVGLDMANSPTNQTVGSVILQDSKFVNTPIGVNSSFSMNSIPAGGGTLVLDNVDFGGSPVAVQNFDGAQILAGGAVVQSWIQGRSYAGSTGQRVQQVLAAPATKPTSLVGPSGAVFERAKPQYEGYPASAFVSVKTAGAKGDGVTDDTDAIQNAMNSITSDQILYFDHGAYIITKTVNVPKNIKMTGEIWPMIMASGAFFGNQDSPQPVFKVGNAGDVGGVEMSDMIFETAGSVPGAVMVEWNSAGDAGANGMWDVHIRIGGSAGTQLQHDTCAKNPNVTHGPNEACIGAHTMLHATQTSSVYIENCWFWVADHELDQPAKPAQIDIYNGRGVLIESQGPMWMYGTASEHSVLYNYQLMNASNIYMGAIQTVSPYFQSNPAAPAPFKVVDGMDPPFDTYTDEADKKAWGVRMVDSSNVLVYGAGLYSFFENYDQQCVDSQTCQNRMVSIEGTTDNLNFFGLSTKAAVSMVSTAGGYVAGTPNSGNTRAVSNVDVPDTDNRSNFCATLALWRPE